MCKWGLRYTLLCAKLLKMRNECEHLCSRATNQTLILQTKTMACTPSQKLVKVGCSTIHFSTISKRVQCINQTSTIDNHDSGYLGMAVQLYV